jgi:hypothetical protein
MPCEFWVTAVRLNVYRCVLERHMKYHDIDCTQFRLCNVMEKRSCTIRGVITGVRWKEKTPVTTGCIWKCKPIPKSRYETQVSSSSYSFHDAVNRVGSSSQPPPLHSSVAESLKVTTVLRHLRLFAEMLNNYCGVLIFIFIFTVYRKLCLILLIFIDCAKISVSFIIIGKCFSTWNPHCRWSNSPNAMSVQLYKKRNFGFAVQLHLYFHLVHNLLLYTVWNSSTGWWAERIK